MRIALLRGPGVDLSAPAEALAEATHLPIFSAGNLFREHVQLQTPLGQRMQAYMQAGDLLPDELMTDLIVAAVGEYHAGWILTNYPRTVNQARSLAGRGLQPALVLELLPTDDEFDAAVRRTSARDPAAVAPEDVLLQRSLYDERREPWRNHFRAQGLLRTARGTGEHHQLVRQVIAEMAED